MTKNSKIRTKKQKLSKMMSIYVHIPFCAHKCFYCSFAVAVGQEHRVDAYLDCLAQESAHYKGEEAGTIYVGGGTPTFLTAAQLQKLFSILRENFRCHEDGEWTVEANPEGFDRAKAEALRSAGVNRLSLGIQSFNDRYLQYLGRKHDSHKAMETYQMARSAGFGNVSADLMFSLPGQTEEEIRKDVKALCALDCDHVSLYMLNVEEHSRFFAQKLQLNDGDLQARHYQLVTHLLEDHGYHQYEISNFARPGKESRHNLAYWEGREYIGLGVGAHSYRGGKLFWNGTRLNRYIQDIREKGTAVAGTDPMTPCQQFKQAVLIGLRMNKGVHIENLRQRFDAAFSQEEEERVERFLKHGWLRLEDGYLKATPRGRIVLDELCAQLI